MTSARPATCSLTSISRSTSSAGSTTSATTRRQGCRRGRALTTKPCSTSNTSWPRRSSARRPIRPATTSTRYSRTSTCTTSPTLPADESAWLVHVDELVYFDEWAAAGVGFEVAHGPRRAAGGRDAAEGFVPGSRVWRGHPLPAASGIAGHQGVLQAGGRVEVLAHEPRRAAGHRHPVDVGEPGAQASRLRRGPGAAAEVLDQREPLVGGVVALAHRPHVAAVADRDRLEQPPGEPGGRHADHAPGAAVPVLDQRRVRGRVVTLADRPHVIGPGRGHAVELVAEFPRIRARHHGPPLAVKVLDQRAERAALALLDAGRPHVVGRHCRR